MTVEAQPTSFPESIDLNSSDEDLIRYVYHRKNGDPLPPNVIANVNPFSIAPSAHDDNWYFCSFEDTEYVKDGKVRKMEGGYWKQKGNDEQIHVNSQTDGRKVSWEFFRGTELFGDRTTWMILEYHCKDKQIQDENDKQEFNSLCRITEYFGNDDQPYLEERHDNINVDKNDAILEAKLLNVHDHEENNSISESAKKSQVADMKEPLLPTRRCHGSINIQSYDHSIQDYFTMEDFVDDCSTEDCLSFVDKISSFFSSEISSPYSCVPNECSDLEAELLSLGGDDDLYIGQKSNADVRVFTDQSDQEVNEPSPSEAAQGNDVDESVPSRRIRNSISSPDTPAVASANLYNREQRSTSPLAMGIPSSSRTSRALRSVFGEGSRKPKRAPSRSSDGSGSGSSGDSGSGRSPLDSSRGSPPSDSGKSSSGSRIKRLGKKYCCLRPF